MWYTRRSKKICKKISIMHLITSQPWGMPNPSCKLASSMSLGRLGSINRKALRMCRHLTWTVHENSKADWHRGDVAWPWVQPWVLFSTQLPAPDLNESEINKLHDIRASLEVIETRVHVRRVLVAKVIAKKASPLRFYCPKDEIIQQFCLHTRLKIARDPWDRIYLRFVFEGNKSIELIPNFPSKWNHLYNSVLNE